MLKEITKYPLSIKGNSSSAFVEVRSPYDGEIVAAIEQTDAAGIESALSVAADCFENTMQRMPAYRRADILDKTAQLIADNSEDLASTIAMEGGKPIKAARIEVARAVNTFATASREALNIEGEQVPMDTLAGNEHRLAIVIREPIGIVAAITPFNFPLNMVAHKVAPAIAAGNVVVLKPSPQTPVASFKLKTLLEKAGLPPAAFQIIPCPVAEAGALVRSAKIAMLTFTGSTAVGWNFRKEIQPGVRLVLELGGNAGVVVHDDADLTAAATAICRGGYNHAGQTCISVQRVYVQNRVYDKFMEILSGLVTSLKIGNPLDDQTDVGPLIDERAIGKVTQWLEEATNSGAKLVMGGKIHPHNLIEPVVLTDTNHGMSVVCKEVFGPVVSVMKYDTLDNAINAMNDTPYGLQANIFTTNLEVAFKAGRRINAGAVHINDASFRLDHMPAGGHKQSGIGLEGLRYAIHEMTQPKLITFNLSDRYGPS